MAGGVNEDHAFLDDMYALSLRELPAVWRKVAVAADAPALPQAPALCSHSAGASVPPRSRKPCNPVGGGVGVDLGGGPTSPTHLSCSFQ